MTLYLVEADRKTFKTVEWHSDEPPKVFREAICNPVHVSSLSEIVPDDLVYKEKCYVAETWNYHGELVDLYVAQET